MLEFKQESSSFVVGRNIVNKTIAVLDIDNPDGVVTIFNISNKATANDLRQIAAKLLELNGGNTMKFIEQDDGVINIKNECGDDIGDLVKRDGIYRLSFLHTYDNADELYQIVDKLKQLNGDQDA